MAFSQCVPDHISRYVPIVSILRIRRYQLIIVTVDAMYALFYMFAVGIISYYPGFAPLKVSTPIVRAESIGIMVIPISYVFIFMFYYAIIFLIGTSFLVGLNIALLLYLRQVADRSFGCYFNSSKTKTGNINIIALRGVSGILPALFTSFACCSGGLISIVIGSTTFSTLAIYSKYIAPLTITVLAAGTVLISRKIVNQLDTGEWINDTNCNSCIINREKE